nr:hypothetical protein Iba_chr12bCG11990 [Ipomoea batatas]
MLAAEASVEAEGPVVADPGAMSLTVLALRLLPEKLFLLLVGMPTKAGVQYLVQQLIVEAEHEVVSGPKNCEGEVSQGVFELLAVDCDDCLAIWNEVEEQRTAEY